MNSKKAIFLLLLANFISGISQGITMLAVPWYFTDIVSQPVLFQKIYFTITLLSIFWGLFAGTLVDRYNRKKIFLWINIVGFVVLGGAGIVGFFGSSYHWLFPTIVYATTYFIYNIHFPALYGLAQEITPTDQYTQVTSKLEVQGQLTWTISGGIAAILISGVSATNWGSFAIPAIKAIPIHQLFLIDAVTYLIALYLVYKITLTPNPNKVVDTASLTDRLKSGFGYLRKHPALFVFGNASLAVFVCILLQATLTNPIYVKNFLHAGGAVYAWSDMVFSGGALVAGFITARVFRSVKTIDGIIILTAVSALMFGFQLFNTNLLLFFISFFIVGFANAAIRIQRVSYIFKQIPNHTIGRASSVFFMTNVLFRLLLTSVFTIPFFHHGENIAYSVAVFSLVCIAAVGALVWVKPRLKD